MDQPTPDGCKLAKDLCRLPEVVREVNAEGFEGDLVDAQRPFPNIGSPAGCYCDLSAFLEVGGCSLPKAVRDRDRHGG